MRGFATPLRFQPSLRCLAQEPWPNSILDLQEAKCIFAIGSNTFEQHPLIARRLVLAKKKGTKKIICADPRYTPTAKHATYLSMFGTDVALLNGLMHHIIENGWEDERTSSKKNEEFWFCKRDGHEGRLRSQERFKDHRRSGT